MASDQPTVDLANRLALRAKEAAQVLGISERKLRAMVPQLPHFRSGGVLLIPVDGLRRWLEERAQLEQNRASRLAEELLGRLAGD